jgi:hypothetical protein
LYQLAVTEGVEEGWHGQGPCFAYIENVARYSTLQADLPTRIVLFELITYWDLVLCITVGKLKII